MANRPDDQVFDQIRAAGTSGPSYDVSNEDVVERLRGWRTRCSFEVGDLKGDSLTVRFLSLPADLDVFAAEIYDFCPDVVDQHFGCMAEAVEAMEEAGRPLPEGMSGLIEGVDLAADDYGLVLLERSLRRDGLLRLWWD